MRCVEAAGRRSALLIPGAVVFVALVFAPPIVSTLAAVRDDAVESGGSALDGTPLRGLKEGPPLTTDDWLEGRALRRMERDREGGDVAAPEAMFRSANLLYREFLFATFGVATKKVVVGRDGWLFFIENVKGYPPPDAAAEVEEVGRVVAALHELCVSRGAVFLAVPIPNRETMIRDRFASGTVPPGELYGPILASLRRRGIPTVDLRPVLDSHEDWFKNDMHWTSIGALSSARLIAEAVRRAAPDLSATGEVPTRFVTFDPIPRNGDLLRLLGFRPGGVLERALYVEETLIGGFLEGPDPAESREVADVVLAGTSFSTGPFASLLGGFLGRRIENASFAGKGPAAAAAALLDDVASGRRSFPRVVILEFPERAVPFGHRKFKNELGPRLRRSGFDPDYAGPGAPLALDPSRLEGATTRPSDSDFIAAEAEGSDPRISIALGGAIPLDGSRAFSIEIETEDGGYVELLAEVDGAWIGVAGATYGPGRRRLILPIRGEGAAASRLRLDPAAAAGAFRIRDARLLERRL